MKKLIRIIFIICIACIISFVLFARNKLQSHIENMAKEYLFTHYQDTYVGDIKVNISFLGINFIAEDVEDKRQSFSATEIKLFYPFFSKHISIKFPKKILYGGMIIESKNPIKIIATSSKSSILNFLQTQSLALDINIIELKKIQLLVSSDNHLKEFNLDIDFVINKILNDEVLINSQIFISNIIWPNKYFDGSIDFKLAAECKFKNDYLSNIFLKKLSMNWPLDVDLFVSGNMYFNNSSRLSKLNIIVDNIENIMRYKGSEDKINRAWIEKIIYLLKNDSKTKHIKNMIEFDISAKGKDFNIGSYSLQQFLNHVEKNNE